MPETMLQFTEVDQAFPEKRPVGDRIGDFSEIFRDYARAKAEIQAARCSQCGIPFCQIHCPLQNNIPDWLKLTAEGRIEEAYELSAATNNFPEICGRICPHDRLCEGNCVIERGFESVTIGSIERHITETAFDMGLVTPPKPLQDLEQSVGIIGAGPAGLAAADMLRRRGYRVDIYDRHDRIGGLLVYGIPNFKLDKAIVARRGEILRRGKVRFHLDFEVGRDASLADLRGRHDALLIATGVYKSRDITVPGVGLENIVMALDYLVAANRHGLGNAAADYEAGPLNAAGKQVVVVGGGDTAMDCLRTAVRQGAKSVKCLYRRDRDNMPGSMREVSHAEEEGVEFVWLAAPEAFLGNGRVNGVRAIRMRLGLPDAGGRQAPEAIADSSFNLPCDLAIKALGFDPEDLPTLFGEPDLALTRWGTIRADLRSLATNLDGVFAAGDIVRGASLVVWAIRDGRDAAAAIDRYIQGKSRARVSGLAPVG
ncbi:MAG: NAD(P)-dependent oxidoreductase [Alphaproteobacteria bacterium]|jgi:glutamate synthase (NADPH/NADH) small chain|nr:NAD(P)-dependent oxidoreductase [Alphaproteobacteria bacterium]MDP6563622.1 NAD(P)-dependent oxidoreductase [Alphaproteobacteria bacterium]MDP6814593.1 NAD(P)-dependent oxidoreductase [Alphaproteobacteria bacterium]